MSSRTTNIPASERDLVLQGGGSLGAYEAGAYKALYEWLSKKDKDEGKETSITFDIIAGTSIGAMNAAVLTSYVIENGTYEGSAERLIDFWKYLSKESIPILGLGHGGIIYMAWIRLLQQEKQPEDTTQQRNLL
jgi:predicted acylesterase/phospholipase RssA